MKLKFSDVFILVFIAGIFLLNCKLTEGFVDGNDNQEDTHETVNKDDKTANENSIGPYDNLVLDNSKKENICDGEEKRWYANKPCDKELIADKNVVDVLGTPIPNKGKQTDFEKDDDKLFMFGQNQCRPECCPSTYSCDHGCVCTNKQQRGLIAKRGGNNLYKNESGN
jgi:hypothetical protein